MNIRYSLAKNMNEKEKDAVLNLVYSTFDAYVGKDYSQEGRDTFYKFINKENLNKIFETGERVIIAEVEEEIIAFLATRNKTHISLFFVDSDFQGRGIGRSILNILEEECLRADEEYISVNSSPYAEKAYMKMGFEKKEELQEKDGICYIPMIKKVKKIII